jgi:hypothetical protein
MASNPTPAEVSQLGEPTDPAQLAEELAREKEEVLRLRDLLIARDAELGTACGRLAELEASSKQLLGRLQKLLPSFVWKYVEGLRGPRS